MSATMKSLLQKTIEHTVKHMSIDPMRKDVENLHSFIRSIEGISHEEIKLALLKLPKQKDNLAVLYKLPVDERLEYVQSLLDDTC